LPLLQVDLVGMLYQRKAHYIEVEALIGQIELWEKQSPP
jgi:hypothetical protein